MRLTTSPPSAPMRATALEHAPSARVRRDGSSANCIAGLSVALGAMSSCHHKIFQPDGMILPPENGTNVNAPASTKGTNTAPSAGITQVSNTEEPVQLMGDVAIVPDSANVEKPKKTTK